LGEEVPSRNGAGRQKYIMMAGSWRVFLLDFLS
jgi:hypothetical protein